MRHQKSGRKLGRNSTHRHAMMSNLAASLVAEERITTTDARAKELRRVAEHLVTLARRASKTTGSDAEKAAAGVHYRRLVQETLGKQDLVKKFFDEIVPRVSKQDDGKPRNGGYTRILKVRRRAGDNAPLSLIEFLGAPIKAKVIKRKEEAAPAASAEEKAEE
jgi:large subunit ribosomal protein L17